MPGVISRILSRVSRFFGSERRSTTFRQPSPWLLTYAKSGAAVGETTAIGISAVWQGLRFISSAVASMPRFVAAEDRSENIIYRKTHPIHRLVSIEPHPAYSSYDFFFALVWQAKLRGNGLAVIVRDERTARPRRLDLVEWKDVIDVEMEPESGFVYYKIQGYARLLRQNARLDKRQQEVFDQLKDLNQEDKDTLTQILRTRFSIEARQKEISDLENIEAQ